VGGGPDGIAVAERPQVVVAFEVAAVEVQAAYVRSRGEQEPAEATSCLVDSRTVRSAGSRRMALVRASSSMPLSSHHGSAWMSAVSRLPSPRRYPFESGGGRRRVRLAADEENGAVGALGAQRFGAARGGDPATHDQEVDLTVRHPQATVVGRLTQAGRAAS